MSYKKEWASREHRDKKSNWFLLVDSKVKPKDVIEEQRVRVAMDGFVQELARELPSIIKFNNTKTRQHAWGPDTIQNVEMKYVLEKGRRNQTIHAHIVLRVNHRSNISLPHEYLNEMATAFLFRETGKKPYVSRPKLITPDRTEEYMSKDIQGEVEWVDLTKQKDKDDDNWILLQELQ